MNIIAINTGTTSNGVKEFKKLLETLSKKENVVYARIRYNKQHLQGEHEHPLRYPLVVYTNDGFAFCLRDVTAGYGGTGPNGMVELLDWLEFDFNEDDILQDNGPFQVVALDLLKGDVVLKNSFKNYDIIYYEYMTKPFMSKKY